MWLEERRVRRPLFEQEVPEGRERGEEGKKEEKGGFCGRDRVRPRPRLYRSRPSEAQAGLGPVLWEPEGWGPEGWRFFFPSPAPKFRAFFLSLGVSSCLFFSLWGSSRVYFSLSGDLLVEFWWCFGRPGPSNVRVFALGLSCESPSAACRPPGLGLAVRAGTFDRCRGRRGCMSLEPWGMRACFDSTTVTEHVLLDICFVVSPSRIIVNVICSILTHSRNTCQGTVHVQLCSLRVSRRVCIRHTLFQSVHSSDLGPHVRLFKQDHVEPSLLFFGEGGVSFFFWHFLYVEHFIFLNK